MQIEEAQEKCEKKRVIGEFILSKYVTKMYEDLKYLNDGSLLS